MMALAQKCTSQTQICMNILYTFMYMYMYMSYIIFEIGVDIEANRSSMISRFGIFGVLVPFSFLLFFFSFFFGKAVPFEFVSNSVIIGINVPEKNMRMKNVPPSTHCIFGESYASAKGEKQQYKVNSMETMNFNEND